MQSQGGPMDNVRRRLQYLVFILLTALTLTSCALVPSELVPTGDAGVDTYPQTDVVQTETNEQSLRPHPLSVRFTPEGSQSLNWVELRQLDRQLNSTTTYRREALTILEDGSYQPVDIPALANGSRVHLQVAWESAASDGTNIESGAFCVLDPTSHRFVFHGALEVRGAVETLWYGHPRLMNGKEAKCWIEFTSLPCPEGSYPVHGNICQTP